MFCKNCKEQRNTQTSSVDSRRGATVPAFFFLISVPILFFCFFGSLCHRMATMESNPASQIPPGYSIESSSIPRSRLDSGSGAIQDAPGAWKKPWSSPGEVGPVMGAESWPALSPSGNKSPSLELESMPQVGGTGTRTPLHSSINPPLQRKPFRRNSSTSSSTSNLPHNPQRSGGSVAPRHPHRSRNGTSYPHHGNRRNQSRDMHLQPQRGFGILRPQMLLGPPSFPPTSAPFLAAPQLGSYGGPMLYPDYHVFLPHPPPDSMPAFLGPFPPPPLCFPTFDALYTKILTQVEFYFSADNLSRDKHLRRQMNHQGWVPVTVIAGFRRLAELTDDIHTILEALRSSQVVEIKGEALRRRGDWDKYLLPHDPAADNASLGSQLESMTLSERSREGE